MITRRAWITVSVAMCLTGGTNRQAFCWLCRQQRGESHSAQRFHSVLNRRHLQADFDIMQSLKRQQLTQQHLSPREELIVKLFEETQLP